ncbi:pilus assembly protein [Polaromonas sp.]|nr:pilus assembly protein [Polaromonas sp.]
MTLRFRHTLLAGLWLIGSSASAGGLQVSPVSLSLPSTQRANSLWLSNTGDSVVRAQVRVYRWTQEGGEDKLTQSSDLTISPPMLQVAAGERQMVRVIRLGMAPSGPSAVQEAYRMVIDELPIEVTAAGVKKGLQFVLSYSVPVFVEPTGPAPRPPQLSWKIHAEGDKATLEVANSGAAHAQLGAMGFTNAAGQRTEINAGLMGYVLPGAQMRWALVPAAKVFASGGTLDAMVNMNVIQQVIAPTVISQ